MSTDSSEDKQTQVQSSAPAVSRTRTGDTGVDTEKLEAELRAVSEQLAVGQARFADIRSELRRRRATKDEQPTPKEVTAADIDAAVTDNLRDQVRVLSLKVTTMESEQAKLVVEAEIAKAAQREAEDRLALVARCLPTKREPMTRDAARELFTQRRISTTGSWTSDHPVDDWMIDAVVEASK